MAKRAKKPVDQTTRIEPGTPEMAALLASGYQMTLEEAQTIVKERDENPDRFPYEVYLKAKAFLEAYKAKPQVVAKGKKGWKRSPAPS